MAVAAFINPADFYPAISGGGFDASSPKLARFLNFLREHSNRQFLDPIVCDFDAVAEDLGRNATELQRNALCQINDRLGKSHCLSPIDIFIHVPFCKSACAFCPFYKVISTDPKKLDSYLFSVFQEVQLWSQLLEKLSNTALHSLYIQGGTPTLLSPLQFDALFESIHRSPINVASTSIVSIEASPDSLHGLSELREIQASARRFFPNHRLRISLGVQTLDDAIVQDLNRSAKRSDVEHALAVLRQFLQDCDQATANGDLLIGLPRQTVSSVQEDVDTLARYALPSITVEQLQLFPGTSLHRKASTLQLPDDGRMRELLQRAYSSLDKHGYAPNKTRLTWALPGHERPPTLRTNVANTLGLGASMAGRLYSLGYDNVSSLSAYKAKVSEGVLPIHTLRLYRKEHEPLRYIRAHLSVFGRVICSKYEEEYGHSFHQTYRRQLGNLKDQSLIHVYDDAVAVDEKAELYEVLCAFTPSIYGSCIEEFEEHVKRHCLPARAF